MAQALAVRAVGRHRVVRVADEDDSRLERDRARRRARRDSRSRPSARGRGGRSAAPPAGWSIGARIRSPSSGCVSITRALLRRQPAGLREDRRRDADLADVVEERAELEPLERMLAEAELAADAEREIGDPARVRRGVLVVRLERVRERLDRRDEAALERLEVRRVRDRELRLVREAGEQPQLTLAEVVVSGSPPTMQPPRVPTTTGATAYETPSSSGSAPTSRIRVRCDHERLVADAERTPHARPRTGGLDEMRCSVGRPAACAAMSQPSSSAIQIELRGEPIRSRRQLDDPLVDLVEARAVASSRANSSSAFALSASRRADS